MLARDLRPRSRGLELEVALPVATRARLVADGFERHGDVEVRVGEAWIGGERFLEIRDGAARLAALEHDVAQVVVGLGLALVDFERAMVELLGAGLVAAAEADVPEVRERDRELGIELQSAAVKI